MDTTPSPSNSSRRILAGLTAVFGTLLLFLSVCGILAYLVEPLRTRDALGTNTLLASLVAIAVLYGGLILFFSFSVLSQRPLPRLRLPSPLFFIALFLLVVGLGQMVLSLNLAPSYLFPPWHVLASGLLPLAALAYAIRHLPPAPAPPIAAELAWGGMGSVLLASVFELVAGAFVLVIAGAMFLLALGPGQIQDLFDRALAVMRGSGDLESLLRLLSQQPVLLVTAAIALISIISILVPLIEELVKSLGPALAIGLLRPKMTTALILGLAAGAGFAFSENLLNSAQGTVPAAGAPAAWAPVMLLRAGASFVHMAATSTVTLGWYYALVLHRRGRFLLFFFIALVAHGSWNFIAIILGGALSYAGLSDQLTGNFSGPGAVIAVLALLVMLFLILAAGLWIVFLVRWVRQRERLEAQ